MTLKIRILRCSRRLFIIWVSLTETLLATTMYIQIFNHNISLQKTHGKPSNVDSRHVGDLGNIETPPSRFTLVSLFDGLISLDAEAENGIAGRAIVVHAGEDDLGMNYFGSGCWAGSFWRGH